jgi:hypothetical protein
MRLSCFRTCYPLSASTRLTCAATPFPFFSVHSGRVCVQCVRSGRLQVSSSTAKAELTCVWRPRPMPAAVFLPFAASSLVCLSSTRRASPFHITCRKPHLCFVGPDVVQLNSPRTTTVLLLLLLLSRWPAASQCSSPSFLPAGTRPSSVPLSGPLQFARP